VTAGNIQLALTPGRSPAPGQRDASAGGGETREQRRLLRTGFWRARLD